MAQKKQQQLMGCVGVMVLAAWFGVTLLLLQIPDGAHSFSLSSHSHSRTKTIPSIRQKATTFTTAIGSSSSNNNNNNNNNDPNGLDSLQNLPFVPPQVLSKFLTNVGTSLTAANLQAGYQAGIVSRDELDDIERLLPEFASSNDNTDDTNTNTDTNQQPQQRIQSISDIRKHWDDAILGEPWYIQRLGSLVAPAVVGLVARLQEKTVGQARAMAWINHAAMEVLNGDGDGDGDGVGDDTAGRVRSLLLDGSGGSSSMVNPSLRFNNTRAKFENDKQVWSASMDVFFQTTPITEKAKEIAIPAPSTTTTTTTAAATALEALMKGTDDDTDDLSSLMGSVTVLDDGGINTGPKLPPKREQTVASTAVVPPPPPAVGVVGLVNAYFIPDEEIKILVVEIEDVLYNVTWKGL